MILRRLLRALMPKSAALWARKYWLVWHVLRGTAYREHDVDLMPRLLKPTDVCWDIGANSGTYTLPMARIAARVVAFEPVPHNLDILRAVVRTARLTNVDIRPIAISDVNGAARMDIPSLGFYGGYYLAALDYNGTLDVQTATIDHLIASGLPEPQFVKCDVEGAEKRVIDGARGLIARRHPVWLLETFDEDVLTLMTSLGYVAHVQLEDDRIVRVDARTEARNYLFLPA